MWYDDAYDYSSSVYSPSYYGSNVEGDDQRGAVHRDQEESNNASTTKDASGTVYQLLSLQDLCCRVIALELPFAYVEHRSPPIPDELQLKIIGFSFPEDEQMIMKYAQFSSRSSVDVSSAKSVLGNVQNLNQIGFRLSATVNHNRCSYYVTVYFDRGKITFAQCSCDQSMTWCAHVIATCLTRLKDKNTVTIRMPVSDSLNLLDQDQLLKFAQYLLYEHQNEGIIETAQQLLDKLLSKEQKEQEEDINAIAGAPDPTAGPGLDEEAHWFVCKSGFQSRCKNLMHGCDNDPGFFNFIDRDSDRKGFVKEVWKRNCFHQALVKDEMDLQLDDGRYGPSSSQQTNILQVLETIADMLQDDFMSAVSALTIFTEQLIEHVLNQVDRRRDRYKCLRLKSRKQEPNLNFKLSGSLAGGFTPRLSNCSVVSDEISRLWRLAVLSPRITAVGDEGIFDALRTLNERVSESLVTGQLHPWNGLEVAMKLSSIDWKLPDFQQVLKGEWTSIPVVNSCMAIQLTCQSKNAYVSELMALDQCTNDVTAITSTKGDSNITLSFYNPHCIAFSTLCSIDIHSVCSMIEALKVAGDHQPAVHLAVAISYALVSFYKKVLFGICNVSSMPVSAKCTLGTAPYQSVTKSGSDQESDFPKEIYVSSDKPCTSSIWPDDTLLAISTFAFLFELLSQKPDLVDASIAEMRTKLRLVSSSANSALDCPKTAMSLKFQLGVVGLCLQKLPASSLHHEVEEYHYECWLTYQLICCGPADADLSFLTHLGQRVCKGIARPSLVPQSSLSRVIFHHLFKSAPAILSNTLSEQPNVGLKVALNVLSHVKKFTVRDSSFTWMLFEYANCRLWAKIAEVVLLSLSDSSELLGEGMSHILHPEGMFGAKSMEKTLIDCRPSNVLSRLRLTELISEKSCVAYCLGLVLSEKKGNSIGSTQYKVQKVQGSKIKGESSELDIPRKILNSGAEKALKLCAVQIVVHSLWLQRFADEGHYSASALWLTDLVASSGVESLEYLVHYKGDVTTVLKQDDLLDLCEKVLKKVQPETQVKPIVQNILLSLLQKASQVQAEDKMRSIISFCKGNRCAPQLDLMPWICTGLQNLHSSNSFVPFQLLIDASNGVLAHYKKRLAKAEKDLSEEKLWKTNLFITGLKPGTTNEDLIDMCSSYGNIISTKAVLDDETKKGYGFVDFESSAEARKALKALRRRGFHAQMAKQQGKDPTNLCFLHLPRDFDEPKLEAMLMKYGKVKSTRILRDADNMNKMVGFARMENTLICKQIIEDFNGEKIEGNVRSLIVKFADLGPRNRQQSRQNHADSSCSTNGQGGRPFYEETHEDDELFYCDESSDSVLAKRNPYRTAEAHPFLGIAFNLGMLGLAKLAEKGYGTDHDGSQYRRAISSMCRLVCYLVKKQWLTEALMEAHVSRSSKQNRLLGSVTANPGCSQWENGYSQSASKESSCDSCFLQDFVSFLINNVDNPMWLFEVLKELGDQLCIDIADGSLTSLEQKQNFRIKSACQGHPPVNLLLQKDLDAFSKLLLGPQMADLVARASRTRDRLIPRPSEIIYQLRQGRISDTRLQEVLQIAKRAFSISDSSGAMFKNLTDKITAEFPLLGQQQEHLLTDEMANKHPVLEQLLERDGWHCLPWFI